MALTWEQVRARRLERQSLLMRAGDVVDVVRDTCGIHAQVQASAELQLAARVDGTTQAALREALWERRTLVKAWTLRGTLHLHPADDLPLWLAAARAVAPADGHELPAWVDPKGVRHPALDRDEVAEIGAAVLDALDGRCLRRDELAEEVVPRVGRKARGRLRSGFAFFGGAELCQGPPQGAKTTVARPDQWLGTWNEVDEQDALREACRRYLRTYGPARPSDFREWFSSSRAFPTEGARTLFASLADELEPVDVDGHEAFVLAGDTTFPARTTPSVRLLPEYDVYVMGFREREHLVPEPVQERVARHGRGRYEGPAGVRFLALDGVIAGLWERRKRARRIELEVRPAEKLTRAQRTDLEHEAERIGAFLGAEAVLSVEPG